MFLIGDIHGKWESLRVFLKRHPDEQVVALGDIGLGFGNHLIQDTETKLWLFADGNNDPTFPESFQFITGNHDNRNFIKEKYAKHYLGDYGVTTKHIPRGQKMFYLSGAFSIDRACRTEGRDWWPEEELTHQELWDATDLYAKEKPDIVISHDAPEGLYSSILHTIHFTSTRTSQALQAMFEIHQPKQWFFGHHHITKTMKARGTEFHCLNELDWYHLK